MQSLSAEPHLQPKDSYKFTHGGISPGRKHAVHIYSYLESPARHCRREGGGGTMLRHAANTFIIKSNFAGPGVHTRLILSKERPAASPTLILRSAQTFKPTKSFKSSLCENTAGRLGPLSAITRAVKEGTRRHDSHNALSHSKHRPRVLLAPPKLGGKTFLLSGLVSIHRRPRFLCGDSSR